MLKVLKDAGMLDDWAFNARREQLSPEGDWSKWLMMGGRGMGKTRAGSEWVLDQVRLGVKRIGLVAPTAADARDVMIEGDSGILNVAKDIERPEYEPTKRRLTFPNGAIATAFSAEEPNRLRGPQHEAVWGDEIAAWKYMEDTYSNMMFGLRLGRRARLFLTTTPRPVKILKDLLKGWRDGDESIVITTGSTYDNIDNLSENFAQEILAAYEGTRLGRQEIYAELLEDLEGALWTYDLLDRQRMENPPVMQLVGVGVDPGISSEEGADETGIVVGGKTARGTGIVLEDATIRGKPVDWAKTAIRMYHKHEANFIIAEKNQGGEMVQHTLHSIDPNVPVELVHASKSKIARAEPVATLYEAGSIFHKGTFTELEDEMTSFDPGLVDTKKGSPNRLDALVWVMHRLMVQPGKKVGVWRN